MVDQCVPNISRMSSIYVSDPPPSNKMSTNTNQIRLIFRRGTKDESSVTHLTQAAKAEGLAGCTPSNITSTSHPEYNKTLQAETSCGNMWMLNQHYHGGFLWHMIP